VILDRHRNGPGGGAARVDEEGKLGGPTPPPEITRLYGVKPVPVMITVSGWPVTATAVFGVSEATTGAASAASPASG